MIAASNVESFFKYLPEILKSAAGSPLGIVALAITATAAVLIILGRGLPPTARSLILILVLFGVGALTWRVISVSQVLPNERGVIEPTQTKTAPVAENRSGGEPAAILAAMNGATHRYKLGVDISHHDVVDWSQLAGTQISFVFVRASQGVSLRDPRLAANWKEAGEAHLQRGAYHFFIADQDGAQQAVNFLKALRESGADSSELPPALDLEEGPKFTRQTVDNFTFVKRVRAWLTAVEVATKRKPIIYAPKWFWDAHGSADLSDYHLWLPRYKSSPPIASDLPLGWKRWALWQFGAEKGFAGFGTVDANILDSEEVAAANSD